MSINDRVKAVVQLGSVFQSLVENTADKENTDAFENLLLKAGEKNPWFTRENTCFSFLSWAEQLKENKIKQWLLPSLDKLKQNRVSKTIGVINAGNIPLVGFHDLLCVFLSGNKYLGKNSFDDPYLLPFVAEKLFALEPELENEISFTERLSGFDAVIATGSNNSARYFDYYFGKYPHIIRMNRNAVAVLTGDEDENDFKKLGNDIFQYFGLGCRSVSKLFVPRSYSFNKFFEAMESFSSIARHNKYMNNHDYNNAIYLLKKIPFLDNGFLLLKEDEAITSPISVVYYEYYDDPKSIEKKLEAEKEKIQCVVSKTNLSQEKTRIGFGNTQRPNLWDYADGVDTLKFLLNL